MGKTVPEVLSNQDKGHSFFQIRTDLGLKPRSQIFREETYQDWVEKDWNENFPMPKDAFNRLCR